jgi:pyruvate dehydrogenase E1 component alpha subunit
VGDPQAYRKEGDLQEWMKKDPIARLETKLVQEGILDEAGKGAIISRIDQVIAEAEQFAESSPYPAPEEALELVYC